MADDHVDVLIVGAGLSGIGAGYHLQANCPDKTYAILEGRGTIGGTWDLFRYPGIRSDSDMYTLGYSFKPWEQAKAIADGPDILEYVRTTASENGIDGHIRFNHRVVRAEWSSEDSLWTVEAEHDGEPVTLTCSFLFGCTGYYRYDEGYTPDFEGMNRFKGPIIHPQHWPEDLDYAGKRVVVIGSGATAVTLVPAMAEDAAKVTMLQRSPAYIVSLPGEDRVANLARRVLPAKAAYALIRWKNVLRSMAFYELSKRRPGIVKKVMKQAAKAQLPKGYDVDTHFKPDYNPWDQRVCLVPNGDLFRSIRHGQAEVVTDRIETFTENGILLESGDELEADIVITATGLNLLPMGGVDVSVDGDEVKLPEKMAYRGMMLSGVPNLAFAIGYTNASWTLKCDLTCEYVCRVLNHMDEHGYRQCVPQNDDPRVTPEPFIDFTSGYVMRSIDKFPKQGSREPWRLYQNYPRDIRLLKRSPLEDGSMKFRTAPSPAPQPEPVAG